MGMHILRSFICKKLKKDVDFFEGVLYNNFCVTERTGKNIAGRLL